MFVKTLRDAIQRSPAAWAAAFLFLFSVAIYSGMLRHGFVWDDEGVIANAPEIRDFANIPTFFTKPLVLGEAERPDTGADPRIRYYRPLLSTLHALEYSVFWVNPFGYKLINLLLNGAVVVCAFLLVRALTGALSVSFLATLLYAANPVRGEVVYWIYSDSHIFAALFSLLAILAYHRGRILLALSLMAVGLFFQEGVILVAGALLLYQLIHCRAEGVKGWRKFVPFVLLAILYLFVRRMIAGSVPVADLDLFYRLRAMAYLLVKHLQISFVTDAPVPMYLYVPGMFGPGGVTTPAILLGAVVFLLVGGWLWWRHRQWFFWYAWFIVWIAIAFNVGNYAGYLMAEKSLYLAVLGPSVLLTAMVTRSRRYYWLGIVLLLSVVGYQVWTTVERGRYWTDTVTYIEELLEFEPRYEVARYQLGVEYQRKGRYAEAIRQWDLLLQLRPDERRQIVILQTDVYEQWGRSLAEQGDLAGALDAFVNAKKLTPGRSSIYNSLGVVHFLCGDRDNAVANWETAVRLDPGNSEARANLERLGQD